LFYFPIYTERFVMVGSAQRTIQTTSALAESSRLLEAQPWLSYGADLPIIRRYWQEVFGRRPAITPSFIFPDLLMIKRAVELDLGISILPDYLCQPEIEAGYIKILHVPETPPSNVLYLVLRREQLQTTKGKWLQTLLRPLDQP